MKNLSLIIFVLVFFKITALSQISQTCLPEGITFTTQSQIDSFQINYPNCTEIEGDVRIEGGDITNLIGLSVLTSFGKALILWDNDVLTSLSGLDNVTSIGGGLDIFNNDALTGLTGLENVTLIGEVLRIYLNATLISLTGLDNLTSIEESLYIEHNDALISLISLDNLSSIGGYLSIANNAALTNLTGFENVTSIGEGIVIWDNAALTSLMGLDNVTSIGGPLWIDNNDALTSLSGLDNVTSIGGLLWISNNDVLISLTKLVNVTSIGGRLWIIGNIVLTSLTGLDNINAGSINDLYIYDNYSLAMCEVQSICDYLASPNGTVEIHDNATGCNTQDEVEEACESVSVEDFYVNANYSVSPNPFTSTTTLNYSLDKSLYIQINIYNHLGEEVEVLVNERQPQGKHQIQWNAEGLPAGIYYYRIQAGEMVGGGKMVVMR